MAVTLQDIARELELSANTVSRSLRHDSGINPQTRARVNETARRLGYKGGGQGAGRPRRKEATDAKKNGLGLLVRRNSLDDMQYDVSLMAMMAGMMSITDKHGMHLKVHTIPDSESGQIDEDSDRIPPIVEDGSCKALIVHGAHHERDLLFFTNRLPVVSIARVYTDLPLDAVVADNIHGIQKLVTHLVDLGHRQLVWVGVRYAASFMEAREVGFVSGCHKHGLEIHAGAQVEDTSSLLCAVKSGVTAFVCGNDGTALKVIEVLEAAGLRIPEDVSVTGFDAQTTLTAKYPKRMTTINPHMFEMGQAAANLALQRLTSPLGQSCVVSVRCEIVIGETTGPATNLSSLSPL